MASKQKRSSVRVSSELPSRTSPTRWHHPSGRLVPPEAVNGNGHDDEDVVDISAEESEEAARPRIP
jgi:hypothetical protein